jgi:hypothetical protein
MKSTYKVLFARRPEPKRKLGISEVRWLLTSVFKRLGVD